MSIFAGTEQFEGNKRTFQYCDKKKAIRLVARGVDSHCGRYAGVTGSGRLKYEECARRSLEANGHESPSRASFHTSHKQHTVPGTPGRIGHDGQYTDQLPLPSPTPPSQTAANADNQVEVYPRAYSDATPLSVSFDLQTPDG